MKRTNRLTEGNILHTLIRFAVPVFFTLFLQALYGGVDLLVVGQFAATADVSGVATGSMLMSTVTMVITGLSMGITILVGERIGRGEPDEAGRAIGGGICLFAAFGVLLTVVLLAGAEPLARLLHAPEEAFAETVEYIRICGGGSLFIVAYNVLGAVFRGIGDARTPLFTVMLACVINIGATCCWWRAFTWARPAPPWPRWPPRRSAWWSPWRLSAAGRTGCPSTSPGGASALTGASSRWS